MARRVARWCLFPLTTLLLCRFGQDSSTRTSYPSSKANVALRNRIGHVYMNAGMEKILALVSQKRHALLLYFLMTPLKNETT